MRRRRHRGGLAHALIIAVCWPSARGRDSTPFTVDVVANCTPFAEEVLRAHAGSPIILTYLTNAPTDTWLLGLTAAAHGLPLVVVGHGRGRFNIASGTGAKITGYLRALQIVEAVARSAAVVVTDATDTVIVNAPSGQTSATKAIKQALETSAVLTSAECGSWPKCYAPLYAHDLVHQQCRAEGNPTCFANSGAYLGSAAALKAMFAEQVRMMTSFAALRKKRRGTLRNMKVGEVHNHSIGGVELNDDQAVLHYLYLNQSRDNLGVTLRMDVHSSFFLSTWRCHDRVWPRVHTVVGPFERCHEMKHDPAARIIQPHPGSASSLRYNASDGSEQQPFLLHANGKDGFLQPSRVRANPRLKHLADTQERMRNAPEALLRHPVLFLDSHSQPCHSMSLADFLRTGSSSILNRRARATRVSVPPPAPSAPLSLITNSPGATGRSEHRCCAFSDHPMVGPALGFNCDAKGGDVHGGCRNACCEGKCCVPILQCRYYNAGALGGTVCADTASNPELKAGRGPNYAHFMLALVYPLLTAMDAGMLRDGSASQLMLVYGSQNMVLVARHKLERILGSNVTCKRALISEDELKAACSRERVITVRVPVMSFYNRTFYSRARLFADVVSSRLGLYRLPLVRPARSVGQVTGLDLRIVVLLRANSTNSKSLEVRERQVHNLSLACDPQYARALGERAGVQLECVSLGAQSSMEQNARAIGGERTIGLLAGHGAGLANLIFMRPGAVLVEIDSVANKDTDRNMYQMLAHAVGVVPTKLWLDNAGRHYPGLQSQPVRHRISPKRPGSTGGWLKGRYSSNVLLKEAVLAATVHNITRRVIGTR